MQQAIVSPAVGPRKRVRRAGGFLLRCSIAVAIFLVLGEAAARLTGFADRVSPFPRRLYVSTAIPDLPYALRPGVSVDVGGSKIDVNELGMRDRGNVPLAPAAGVHRVLVVGDSVAFGWRQNVDHAFPRQLETRLNTEDPGRWEVLNGGVPGYNSVAEAAWFRERGLALSPETVLVAVNLNDFDVVPHVTGLGILSMSDYDRPSSLSLANWSELYIALRWVSLLLHGNLRNTAANKPVEERTPGEWDPFDRYASHLRKNFYRAPNEPQWGEMQRAWGDLGKRARERGIRLVFLIFPDGDQIGVESPDLTPQERLLEVCRSEHLECVDLTPLFQQAPSGTSLFMDIMHPNDAGHAIAADAATRLLRP